MKLYTVNIIEMNNNDLVGHQSFTHDDEGIKEAEKIFKDEALAKGATEEEIESFLDDGYYESSHYQLFLTHSD